MADIRETQSDFEEMMRTATAGDRRTIYIMQPVTITEDSDGHVASAQPTIQGAVTDPTGKVTYENLPVLNDLPVIYPQGGGHTLTFPIKKGDEAFVIHAHRPIDAWHQNGGTDNKPIDARLHSLSDGMVLVGVRSTPRKLNPKPSTDSTQLRSDDGKHFVETAKDRGVKVSVDNGAHTIDVHKDEGITVKTTKKLDLQPQDSYTPMVKKTLIKITDGRVDLGGLGGKRVMTEGGLSEVVYAVIKKPT